MRSVGLILLGLLPSLQDGVSRQARELVEKLRSEFWREWAEREKRR